MNIVLTGFMASGKSTVARLLAKRLNRGFADTDSIIEEKEKMAISEIFEKYGEEYFRTLEKNAVCEIAKRDNIVIATGGGAVLDKANIQELRKNGIIINLMPDSEVIKERLSGDNTRPLASGRNFLEILERFEKRKPFYDDCDYQIRITRDIDPEGVFRKIIEMIGDRI